VIGRLHGDFFSSNCTLINGVEMNIKLTHAPSLFYLLGHADHSEVKIKVMDSNVFVTQAELNPSIILPHAKVLSRKKPQYPVTYTQIKTCTTVSGAQQISIDNTTHSSGLFNEECFYGELKIPLVSAHSLLISSSFIIMI
jgi:hypothetical protein